LQLSKELRIVKTFHGDRSAVKLSAALDVPCGLVAVNKKPGRRRIGH
jgi:hypothetical protein